MSGKTEVPEEAVKAAARAFYGSAIDDISDDDMKYALDQMRESLEAAAPFIAAKALEDAADTFSACSPEGEYSSTPTQVIGWMRDQAAAVRGEG